MLNDLNKVRNRSRAHENHDIIKNLTLDFTLSYK
jgi:hypothetical protein